MNKRKLGSFALFAMLLALCVTAEAQQPKTIFRIGYLSSFDPVTDPRIEGIRQSLREFGHYKDRTLRSSTEIRRGRLIRSPRLPPRCCVLRLTLSSYQQVTRRSGRS